MSENVEMRDFMDFEDMISLFIFFYTLSRKVNTLLVKQVLVEIIVTFVFSNKMMSTQKWFYSQSNASFRLTTWKNLYAYGCLISFFFQVEKEFFCSVTVSYKRCSSPLNKASRNKLLSSDFHCFAFFFFILLSHLWIFIPE